VIDENGQMIGVISLNEAMNLAEQKELDLVKVSPEAKPPVCKILDYGKFRYEQSRREKDAKKNQKTVTIKEVRTSVRVADYDLNVKVKNIQKFIQDGDKVKVSVRFRGREMAYPEKGRDLLLKIKDIIGEECIIERAPKMEGRSYVMYLAPKK
jgi:translation initiation factor IF-3